MSDLALEDLPSEEDGYRHVFDEHGRECKVLAFPQPGPQYHLIKSPYFETFFGGARGGGKTYGICIDWVAHVQRLRKRGAVPKGIIFRKTTNELDEVVETFRRVLVPLGGIWKAGARIFVMPCGATVKLRHLERPADASKYQGHQYTWMGFDEITNWPSPGPIFEVMATVRGDAQCRVVLTGNPGGKGHNWVKARYVDPFPTGMRPIYDEDMETWRVFIPSLLSDNPALTESDPNYESRLKGSGPDWLVRAWLRGDWNIVAGGMFDDVWGAGNILPPFQIPQSWRVDRSFDWGSARPFSVGWHAESDGTTAVSDGGDLIYFPRGTIIRIAEWYGCGSEPNTGLGLLASEVAAGIKERESHIRQNLLSGQRIYPGPADTSIWTADGGASIASVMEQLPNHIKWTKADKRPGSRVSGWNKLREMIRYGRDRDNEFPGYYVFDHCHHTIRILPSLPRDDKNIEDLDTQTEDHVADEIRYRVASVRAKASQLRVGGL